MSKQHYIPNHVKKLLFRVLRDTRLTRVTTLDRHFPQGKAMRSAMLESWPEKKEILSVIPEHCFKKDTLKSLAYALASVVITGACGVFAYLYIPMKVWTSYILR